MEPKHELSLGAKVVVILEDKAVLCTIVGFSADGTANLHEVRRDKKIMGVGGVPHSNTPKLHHYTHIEEN
jgi:hypothetical protein